MRSLRHRSTRSVIPRIEKALSGDIHCSFCGKPRAELRKCVAGPGVYICDRCVLDALACMMETEAPVTA
jgi:hypothetical protein